MSTTMVSAVLEIEREAEGVISAAKLEAEKLVADAVARRDATSGEILGKARREVADLEAKAMAEREAKTRELASAGAAALAAVKNVSEAAYDDGVRHVLKALTER